MDYTKALNESETLSRSLKIIEELIMDWAVNKQRLDKNFIKIHGTYMDRMDDFPEKWIGMTVNGYFFSRALCDPDSLRKFYKYAKAELPPKEEELLSCWKRKPPVWSLFVVNSKEEKEFLKTTDLLTGEERLLYSPGVSNIMREPEGKKRLFLCIVLSNNTWWETYGIIRNYKGYTARDFSGLIEYMDTEVFRKKGLSGFINKYYARFLLIDRGGETPPIVMRDEVLEQCWTETGLEDFNLSGFNSSQLCCVNMGW